MSERCVVVRYKVKPERVEEHEGLIRRVFAELTEQRPAGVDYQAMKLEDGVSFVHVAKIATANGKNPLTELASFKAFTANIGERCDEKPVSSTVATAFVVG
jgi:hypothetical protein